MRILYYGFFGLLALIVGAASFLYVALPTDFVRTEIASLVHAKTGRLLTIEGGVSMAFYPDVVVEVTGVSLSNPTGMGGEPFVTARSLGLKVPLWPLLRQELQVERLTLVEPIVTFRKDKAGRRTWDFGKTEVAAVPPADAPPVRGAKEAAQSRQPAAAGTSALAGLAFDDVRISNGLLRFVDDKAGTAEEISDVTLRLSLASLKGALKAEGGVSYAGERMTVSGEAGPAGNLLTGEPVDLLAKLGGAKATTAFNGRLAIGGSPPVTGRLDMTAPSLRALAAWLGHPLTPGPGLGEIKLAADIRVTGSGLTLGNLTTTIDGMTATGTAAIDRSGVRPKLTADLSIDRLDLNTYISTPVAPAKGKDDSRPPEEADASGAEGWSTRQFELAALRTADAEITLKLGGLKYRDIQTGRTSAQASLKDGVLKTKFTELKAYEGKGVGTLLLDAKVATVKIQANFTLKSVDVRPLMTATSGLARLSGRGNVSFSFAGAGKNQRDVVSTLMGQGRLDVADGSIAGFDVANTVTALKSGRAFNWKDDPGAATPFASLKASVSITNGIATNDDLLLEGPALRLTGSGKVNLPSRSLDYALAPQVLTDSAPPDDLTTASTTTAGFTVPIRVNGPWAKPKFALDLGAIARNPGAAVETVKQALKSVKGGEKVGEVVQKLADTKEGKAVGDLLQGLLGKKQAGEALGLNGEAAAN